MGINRKTGLELLSVAGDGFGLLAIEQGWLVSHLRKAVSLAGRELPGAMDADHSRSREGFRCRMIDLDLMGRARARGGGAGSYAGLLCLCLAVVDAVGLSACPGLLCKITFLFSNRLVSYAKRS